MLPSIFPALIQTLLPSVGVASSSVDLVGYGGDRFGFQTARGDLDGDGEIDVVVTAPHEAGGNAAYVFFGPLPLDGSTTLDPTEAAIAITGSVGDETGWSVSVGDVLGDRQLDLIIGSPSDNGGDGAVQVFEGPLMPGEYLTSDATYEVAGAPGQGYAGWSVTAGDFDGDGKDELVVGACQDYGDNGAAYLLDVDLAPPADVTNGTAVFFGLGRTGCSVANAGDFNGDGYADLVVGSHGTAQLGLGSWSGAVSLIYGRDAFLSSYDLRNGVPESMDIAHIRAEDVGSNFGFDIAPAGDLNRDGHDDLLIGAPALECDDAGCAGRTRTGRTYVILGTPDVGPGGGMNRGLWGVNDGSQVADLIYESTAFDDHTGISVAGAGYAGKTYSKLTSPIAPANPLTLGDAMMFGTGADFAYVIPYDARPRLADFPKYECKFEPEESTCVLTPSSIPPHRTTTRIRLQDLKVGGARFVGSPLSRFGREVLGAGDLDGDGDNELLFGAPHQLRFDDIAGDGEAHAFIGK